MPTTIAKLFKSAGVRPRRALAEASQRKLLSKVGCRIPKAVADFYQSCNGGRIAAIQCRFYPLAEAVDLIGAYDFVASLHFLPLFVSENNESDPCMVGLDGPLAGYVFQICHDGPSRVHAPNINALLRSLSGISTDGFLIIEDHTFVYPKLLTASEAKTVGKLIDLSKTEREIEYEPALMIELAMSMMTDDDCVSVIGDINHPDHNARHEITYRYKRIGTPAAKRALKRHETDVKSFVKRAIAFLTKSGFTATTTDGLNIHVKEGNSHLNIPVFYDRKDSPDCWDYLLERVRYFAS